MVVAGSNPDVTLLADDGVTRYTPPSSLFYRSDAEVTSASMIFRHFLGPLDLDSLESPESSDPSLDSPEVRRWREAFGELVIAYESLVEDYWEYRVNSRLIRDDLFKTLRSAVARLPSQNQNQ